MRTRLAVLNRLFSSHAGGAESYSVALANVLAARTDAQGRALYEVHVFAQQLQPQAPRLHLHKVPGLGRHLRWINQWWFAFYTWLKTRRGFIVISHENTWHGQIQVVHVRPIRFNLLRPGNVALRGWRKAMRVLRIALSPRLLSYWWLEGARMRAPCVVAVSDIARAQVRAAYPRLGGEQLWVVPPGVAKPNATLTRAEAIAALAQRGIVLQESTPVLLFVANDYARKGLDTVIEAMEQMRRMNPSTRPQAHLLVVGNPAQKATYAALAQSARLDGYVHFAGLLVDMAVAYRAADVLVHPTREDTFAMVVLEAMSYGVPVVVSDAPYCGSSVLLRHEHHALLLPEPTDAHHLALQMVRVLGDQELRRTLAAEGCSFAQAYSWERTGAVYETLIDQYAQGQRQRR